MTSHFRKEKITNGIRELAATFIEKESNMTSLITVTRVDLSEDNKHANIMISVIPKEKENAALGYIKRNLGELRKYIIKELRINPTPYLDVMIDLGEKNRQKIDGLLKNS